MEKITHITYRTADGKEFDTEELCREYEATLTIPEGVVLMDDKKRLLTDTNDLDICYFAYLPTQETVDWFFMINKWRGLSCDGRVVAGEHLYYDKDDEGYWHSYEEDLQDIENSLKEFDKLINF